MNLLEERQLVFEARGLEDGSSTRTCKKINDSVYELYMPPPTRKADIDILFFHGLQLDEASGPHISTWRSNSGLAHETIWPKQWIPEEFPNARVLAISYDGNLKKSDRGGRMDPYLVAESLLQALMLADAGQARQVILIGHCVGGLIIKMICSLAMRPQGASTPTEQRLMFLTSIRGIFYFGTPHQGSQFFNVVEKSDIKQGELVKFVRVFSKDLARLTKEFQNLRNNDCFKWHIADVGETSPTDLGGGVNVVVVEEASARCENERRSLFDLSSPGKVQHHLSDRGGLYSQC